MKQLFITSLLFALSVNAQVGGGGAIGTPTGTGAGSGAIGTGMNPGTGTSNTSDPGTFNSGTFSPGTTTTTAPVGTGSTTVGPNPESLNTAPTSAPTVNPDGSVNYNDAIGPTFPNSANPNVRQSQEETEPLRFPPTQTPGQPANFDLNGRPIVP